MVKYRIIALILALTVIASLFAACAGELPNELTINDVTVYLGGDAVAVNPRFSGKEEAISYEYDEYYLQILNGKVKGLEEGVFEVKAKSQNCEATFKVECISPLKVNDFYAWVDYPDADIPAKVNVAGEVTYSYDGDVVQVIGNKVKALKAGNAEITAKIGTFETTFNVTALEVNRNDPLYYYIFPNGADWKWESRALSNRLKYNSEGTDGKTTVFIGDSFFDIDFFSTFYTDYRGKDALCLGVGGTTSHTWEMFFDEIFDGISPKNIVVQLGNNNIYNDQTMAADAAEDIQRFFTYLHGKCPESKVYYFAVTPRDGAALWAPEVLKLNKLMGKYCENRNWITFLDTNDVITADHLRDGIHIKPEHYIILVNALYEAGMEVEDN